MATNVIMPHMGESVVEGTILKWLKQPGDQVAEDESLVEISTDKIDVEVPAPASGVLLEILAEEGATVEVGATVAVIGEAGERVEAKPPEVKRPAKKPVAAKPAPPAEEEAAPPTVEVARPKPPTPPEAVAPPQAEVPAEPVAREAAAPRPAGPVYIGALGALASPAIRRLARELGVNLAEIEGTGRMGRVTKEDVQAHAQRRAAEAAASAAEEERAEAERPQREVGEDEELVPLTRMRRAIAEHMVRSKRVAPHVTTVAEVDMTGVAELREQHKDEYAEQGVKLTYMPFICSAVARALKEHPDLNAEWTDEGIIIKYRINLGIAVAVEEGLVVPVIHGADKLTMPELARAVQAVAEKTRAGKVSPKDVSDATFSITNAGVFGAVISTPIINQPQAAILSTGRIADVPAVVDGEIAIRKHMFLSLSYDHRIVDGATAVQFLQRVREILEQADFNLA